MEVIKTRSALLSNFEVLGRLKELEAEQQIHARAALVKREDDETGHQPSTIEALGAIVSENMRTIQFEAIQYLSTYPLLTDRQDEAQVARLLQALQPYALTKIEKLQIVNLTPLRPVELYVIIEEFEERFTSEDMDNILGMVRRCLNEPRPDDLALPERSEGVEVEPYVAEVIQNLDVALDEDGWDGDESNFVDQGPLGEEVDDLVDADDSD